jgi:ATP/maltotriose-dependent transcriptional regulator MalT
VARPRLDRRLDEVWDRRLALVAAPAGYGKSVLLSQWHQAARRGPISWLSLDERDHDPVRMGRHLLGCLADVDPGLGRQAGAVLGSPAAGLGDEVVDLLLEDFASLTTDAVVVFEDLDHVEGEPVLDDLTRLVMEAPPPVHFVVASRSDPAMPTHRLRTTGQLLELRAADLSFSSGEAAELVRALSGYELGDDEADHLVQVTEGWPVAVQLAALSLRGGAEVGAITRFGATDRGIVDYLSAELLGRLRSELRSFLLDVSVLHHLDPGLCNAVTRRRDGADLLAELRQDAVFVVPLGDNSGGYRLHRLVRAFLRHDLALTDPDRPAVLQERAATWCLDHADPGQAAEYLMAARAWGRLVDLVYRHGRALWDQGQVETVLGWMQALPAPVRREHTRLRLTEAALHVAAGRPEASASLLAAVERDGELTAGEQVVADVLVCCLVEAANPGPEALRRQERSLAAIGSIARADIPDVLEASDPTSLTCLLHFTGAKIRLLLGAPGALANAEAAANAPPSTLPNFLVQALGTVGLIEALANRGSAVASAQRALELAAEHLADEHPAPLPAEVALAVAARNRGDLDAAHALGDAALARALRWRRWPMIGFIIGERALVELARGAPQAALSWLGRSSELGGGPLAPMVAGRFLAIERRARAALGDSDGPVADDAASASWELALTDVALAVEADDPTRARKALEGWPAACSPLGDLERELATALVERAEGAVAAARSRVVDLLAVTARDGHVGPLASAGKAAVGLITDVTRKRPGRHAQLVLAATRRAAGQSPELVDPLSDRELELLRLLPSRMSNAELGRALFVSTNTVKTHLKHVYQKLGVADRDGAVQRARELRLLPP